MVQRRYQYTSFWTGCQFDIAKRDLPPYHRSHQSPMSSIYFVCGLVLCYTQ